MSIYPTTTTTVSAFSEYNSNIVNRLTRMISLGDNCLKTTQSCDVSIDTTAPTTCVIISEGTFFKDDCLHSIDAEFNVDMTDVDFYISSDHWDLPGYYLIALDYTYSKSKPPPRVSIKIFRPNEHALLTSGYLFIKAVLVQLNGFNYEIVSLHDYLPTDPTIRRTYAKSYVDAEDFLPTPFVPLRDEGRIIYVRNTGVYFGREGIWEFISNGVDADTTLCNVGDLVYLGADNLCHLASALHISTFTKAVCIRVGSNNEGKVILQGYVQDVPVESSNTILIGDNLYLSNIEPGKVTNVITTPRSQAIGVCTKASVGSLCDIWFLPGNSTIDYQTQIDIANNNLKQLATDSHGTSYALTESINGSTRTTGVFANNSTKVDLSSYRTWYTSPTGATITEFIGGNQDDIRNIIFANNLTTIQNNSKIILSGGSFTGVYNQILTLMYVNGAWREIGNTKSSNKVTKTIIETDWIDASSGGGIGSIYEINNTFNDKDVIASLFMDDVEIYPQEISATSSKIYIKIVPEDSTSSVQVNISLADSSVNITTWLGVPGAYYQDISTGIINVNNAIITCYDMSTNKKILPKDIEIIAANTIRVYMPVNTTSLTVLVDEADFIDTIMNTDWVAGLGSYYYDLDISSIDSTSIVTYFYDNITNKQIIPEREKLINPTTLRVWMTIHTRNIVVLIDSTHNITSIIDFVDPVVPYMTYYTDIDISPINSTDVIISCYDIIFNRLISVPISDFAIEIESETNAIAWSNSDTYKVKVVISG